MERKHTLESIGILSLSLLLTSSMVISGTLPAMLQHFAERSRVSVEYLVSAPQVAMMIMIALSPFIIKILSERFTIILGLCIIGTAGTVPFFFDIFSVIMLSRILLGIGIGLINTRAVSMIGERYEGETRARLLGFRQSAETIGQTLMTLAVGQLLIISWKSSFLVYTFSFAVLILYLISVPAADNSRKMESGTGEPKEIRNKRRGMTRKELAFSLSNAVFAGVLISTNVTNALRIPGYIVESGIGTAVDGNNILSLSMFAGFLSGLAFGKIMSKLKRLFLPCLLFTGAAGLLLIALTGNRLGVTAGAFISGFSVAGCVSYVFTSLSENVTKASLNTANTFVLVGCNLGASSTPLILKMIGTVNPELFASFLAYAVLFLCIGAVIFAASYLKRI